MHLEDPETVTGAVASLVSDSMRTTVNRASPDGPRETVTTKRRGS